MSVPSYQELKNLSKDELISLHDISAIETNTGSVNYYLEELYRKEQNEQTEAMLKYTKQIKVFTIIVTIATIISTILTVYTLLK